MLVLLVIVAFATLFVRMPRWLSVLVSVLCVGLGLVMMLIGWVGNYWDDHMRPSADSEAAPVLLTGSLLVLSRIVTFFRWVLAVLMAPPAP